MAETSPPIGCDCLRRVNDALRPQNTSVKPYYVLSNEFIGSPWPIETVQIEKGRGRAKAMALFASYCPFCGKPAKQSLTEGKERAHG